MKKLTLLLFLICFIASPLLTQAATLAEKLSGQILLQVEENGEAWYINPATQEKHFLGRPNDAFALMRELGLGITNDNLAKIPVGMVALSGDDNDNDGLPNTMEEAVGTNKDQSDTDGDNYDDKTELLNGYNPIGDGRINYDTNLVNRLSGKIVLQVESAGEAWYINPVDSKRYYLGRPMDAFQVMRSLGLGISNNDINSIPSATQPSEVPIANPDSNREEPEPVVINVPTAEEGFMLNSSILVVLPPYYFKDEEYETVKNFFAEKNLPIVTTSSAAEAVSTKDQKVTVDRLVYETDDILDYIAVIFIGGPGAQVYFDDEDTQAMANRFRQANKIIAALDIAPGILAHANLINNVNVTSSPSQKEIIEANGGNYLNQPIVSDQNIITVKDPAATQLMLETLYANITK